MKEISALIVLGVICCSSAAGQNNCSYITYSLISDQLTIGTACDVNLNQAVTETQTYNVWCVNQINNSTYFTANPNPQITSTGQTTEGCIAPRIDCYPDFEPQSVNAGFTNSSDNINRFYLRVWDRTRSGSQCTKVGFQQNLQQCAAVACAGGGGSGGGCTPNPGTIQGAGPVGYFVQ